MSGTIHQLPIFDDDGQPLTAILTDEEWERCRGEGFTDREAAAWWVLHALPNLCGGDRVTLMHDYPQHKKHLLAASTGRVVEVTPELAIVDGHLEVVGVRGDSWFVEVYGDEVRDANGRVIGTEPVKHSGQVVITIDSAQGVGKTNSIVLAVDKKDRRPLACFWDNTVLHDDLALIAQMVFVLFTPRKRSPLHHDSVTVYCEADGTGRTTAHELTFLGVPHELFYQRQDDNAEKCVTQAKRRIEASPRHAPLVLQEECDELTRDDRKQFKGRKDCLMMYGLANVVIDERPYKHPINLQAEKERRNAMSFAASLRDHDEQNRAGARPKWGT